MSLGADDVPTSGHHWEQVSHLVGMWWPVRVGRAWESSASCEPEPAPKRVPRQERAERRLAGGCLVPGLRRPQRASGR